MAEAGQLETDALALLVVPLEFPGDKGADPTWHRWNKAYGEFCGLNASRNAVQWEPPFKHYPGVKYFDDHIRRLLFPGRDDPGERWIHCPDDLYLLAAEKSGEDHVRARIDLLEILTVPSRSDSAFGLIHLSLESDQPTEKPDAYPLWWAWAVRSHLRGSTVNQPHLELRNGDSSTALKGTRPIRELVAQTLGVPHPDLERRICSIVMAPCPKDCVDAEREDEWLQAMGGLGRTLSAERALPAGCSQKIGKLTVLVREKRAVLTQSARLTRPDARAFRTFWSESLLVGFLQHDSVEYFQARLAAIGSPVDPGIEPLYEEWLEFRNRIWWPHLSSTSAIPQGLLSTVRTSRGTEQLFNELKDDLVTYEAERRRAVEGKREPALARIEIAGVVVGVLGVLLTLIAVSGAHGAVLLTALVAVSFLIALGFGALVLRLLHPGE